MPKVSVYVRPTTGNRTPKKATKGSIGPFYLRYELNGKRVWESLTTRTYTFAFADGRSKESSLLREEATPPKPSRRAEVLRGASNGIYPRQKNHIQEGRNSTGSGHHFVLREGDARVSGHRQEIEPSADHQTGLGLLPPINLEANVFYCVMAPRAANRHIPYPPALPHKFVRHQRPCQCCGDTLSACPTIEGRHRRCKRHPARCGNYLRAEVNSKSEATPMTKPDLPYESI